MAPKRIKVQDFGDVILGSDSGYEKWLGKKGRECLMTSDTSAEVADFESLVDGGTYTWGPLISRKGDDGIDNDRNRQVVALRKRVLDLEVKDSRAVSLTEYYQEKMKQGRVLEWHPHVEDGNTAALPTPLRGERPQGGENAVVKPDWERIANEHQLVPLYSNGYEVGYIGPKIPDIAFYPLTIQKPTAGDFVAFGDAKGSDWTGTSTAEKGLVMMYGHRILDAQPQRSHVYGFITNNQQVLLVRAERVIDDATSMIIRWRFSQLLRFEHGMKIFFFLLQVESGYIKPPSVMGNIVEIRQPLRPGGTCRAFTAKYRGAEVVGKLYAVSSKAAEDAAKINRVQGILQKSVAAKPRAYIPNVVGQEGEWLLLTPLGTRFTSSSFKLHHLKMLLETLCIVHQANIVHRDVRFANILLLSGDQILLNDWGSSTDGGSVQLVAGCPHPLCHKDLVGVTDAVPKPKHDLYSLVVSTARLLLPGMSDAGHAQTLAAAFVAAEQLDYDGIARVFQQVVFA